MSAAPYCLAVLSDIHADLHALDDALASIARLGCDAIVCAGDVIDFGLFPDETIARLVEREIPTIRGNHDRWAVTERGASTLSESAAELTAESRAWLRTLPERWSVTVAGVRVVVAHGSPRGDMEGLDPEGLDAAYVRRFLDLAEADVLIVGHTHRAFEVELVGRGRIINPAALLRDPGPGEDCPPTPGTFGVLALPEAVFTVHRAKDAAEVEIPRVRHY